MEKNPIRQDSYISVSAWVVSLHTNTSKHTKVTLKCVLHGSVGTVTGLSSAMTNSLHNCIHPSEMGVNPLKMACGCPSGKVIKLKSQTPRVYSLECHVGDTSKKKESEMPHDAFGSQSPSTLSSRWGREVVYHPHARVTWSLFTIMFAHDQGELHHHAH